MQCAVKDYFLNPKFWHSKYCSKTSVVLACKFMLCIELLPNTSSQVSFFFTVNKTFLFQLFDKDNHLNKNAEKYLFNTEGHIFPISKTFRKKPWEDVMKPVVDVELQNDLTTVVDARANNSMSNVSMTFYQPLPLFLACHTVFFDEFELQSFISH